MKRGYADTPFGQIHYRIEGKDKPGTPVIFLHQTPTSSIEMVPLLERVGKVRPAIGMDTMGYGQSDRPNPPFTTAEEFAKSIAAFIKALGYEKANLFGFLTGSQFAMQTAADFPDLVENVVISECFNWGTPSRRAVHERIHRYHPRKEDGSHIMELWARSGRGKDVKAREMRLKDFLYVNDDTGAEVYGGMGWEGAGPFAMTHQDMWSVAPRVKAPVYVLYFKDSERGRALERFLSTIPRSKGNNNAPKMNEDPDAFAQLLLDYYANPGI